MFVTHNGSKIYYKIVGNGQKVITFLCGWGYGSEILKPFEKCFEQYRKIFIDFVMFGRSENIKQNWSVQDYVILVKKILDKEKITKTKIIAHSFGGKVAICLASDYNIVESLVLVASAGVKSRFICLTKLKIICYSLAKKLKLNTNKFGSKDYKQLPCNARKTFVNIVNFHVLNICKNIKVKTLIIAGKKDNATPLYMQKKLHKNIKGSQLVVLNGGHYVWVNNFFRVVQIINQFFKEE